MASPQPNPFLKYSKEILGAKMKTRISGVQNQVFEAVMMLTWGANPPVAFAEIENKDIAELTGVSRQNVYRAKNELIEMRMIVVKNDYASEPILTTEEGVVNIDYAQGNLLGIQKDYEKWRKLPKKRRVVKNDYGAYSILTTPEVATPIIALEKEKKKNIKKKVPAKKRAPSTSPLRSYSYPDWLNRELWRDYCQMRARIKKPIATEGTITRRLNKLKSLIDAGHDQTRLFELAIDNSWRDFYPPKGPIRSSTRDPGKKYPVCRQCGQQADNIIRGQECPFCGGEA